MTTAIPSPFKGEPPAPANDTDRFNIVQDMLDSGDMRALWVAVDRDGLAKPILEAVRKHVGMTDRELSARIRSFLAHTTADVRASRGGQLLAAWYAPLPAQAALFDMEAAQ